MELKGTFLIAALISCSINISLAGEIIDLTDDCGAPNDNPSAEVTSVLLDGCDQDTDSACKAVKGEPATGKLIFKVKKEIKTMKCSLAAKVGTWLPFPGGGCGEKDGCKALEGNCPLKVGDTGTIDISITPPSYAPAVKLTGKYIQMDGKDTAICFTFPMNIENPVNPVTHSTKSTKSPNTQTPVTGKSPVTHSSNPTEPSKSTEQTKSPNTQTPVTGKSPVTHPSNPTEPSKPTKSPTTKNPTTNSGNKFSINVSIMVAILIVNLCL